MQVQPDASVSTFGGAFLINIKSDWEHHGHTYTAGSLLSVPITQWFYQPNEASVELESTERYTMLCLFPIVV